MHRNIDTNGTNKNNNTAMIFIRATLNNTQIMDATRRK
jgi:hypothetical protein